MNARAWPRNFRPNASATGSRWTCTTGSCKTFMRLAYPWS
jgi:hypothetical protein